MTLDESLRRELMTMRYGICIWNFYAETTTLPELVHEFADMGFDAASFTTAQLRTLPRDEVQAAATAVRDRDVAVTLHGNFEIDVTEVLGFVETFASSLLTVTCDAAMTTDSRGTFHDAARMAPFLGAILDATEGTEVRVGVEDFPLDDAALDFYRADLEPLLASPRYGMLIDVGHMNMRLTDVEYFDGVGVRDYFANAPLPVVEVHLHDNDGHSDQHAYFGFGNIEFGEVAAALDEIGFDGVSTIEIAPGFFGMDREEAKPHARESLRRWRELWPRVS